MTQTGRINQGRGHHYLLDGEKVPGVTTIIGDGFPKPALINWSANTTAEYAVDRWDELTELSVSERLNRLKKCRYEDRDAAARRGTEVHGLAQRLAVGEQVDVPDELAGHVEAYVRFLDEWDAAPVAVERPCFSRRYKYGGTFDLVADLADGQRWLLDVKTNRSGPFGDTAFQLAAYAGADFYLDENDHEVAMPLVGGCGVVWVRADGADLYPFRADSHVFRQFLYIAQTAQAASASRDYKHDALTAPHGAAA